MNVHSFEMFFGPQIRYFFGWKCHSRGIDYWDFWKQLKLYSDTNICWNAATLLFISC